MKADIVIVAYGEPEEIDAGLRALNDPDRVASVTVVDNGDGRSAACAERHGAVGIHLPANPGFGAAVNRGAAGGHAECLLVLNPDARLTDTAIASGIRRLGRDPEIGAVQGAIVNAVTGTEERSAGRELGVAHLVGRLLHARALLRFSPVRTLAARVPLLADHARRRPEQDTAVETLAATAVLIRRTAFEAVGGFDERFFLYGEDLDLCRRLRAAGWKLVTTPEVAAIHRSGGSSASTWDRELRWWQGTLVFARRTWPGIRGIAARVIGMAEALVLIAQRPRRAREVLHAFGGRR